MFPLNDFNLVCCALATVSAAVGYRYSRRRFDRLPRLSRAFDFTLHSRKQRSNSTTSDITCSTPSSVDTEGSDFGFIPLDYPTPESIADITEPNSLKRKHREEDEAIDNSNEESMNMYKRMRISPTEEHIDIKSEPMEIVLETTEPPAVEPACVGVEELVQSVETACVSVEEPVQLTGSAAPVATSPALGNATYTIPSAYKPSTAFSAFAGSSSPFAITGGAVSERPAWCSPSGDETKVLNPTSAETADKDATAQKDVAAESSSVTVEKLENPLAAQTYAKSTETATSGEENEETIAELKGAKLFIKRGTKEFSTGMLGHIKLLSDKKTTEERLVFRREPVWKVSMSVRLRPTVRCSFDEEQAVLRITLKEVDESTGDQQIVVYALKRGKLAKPDFTSFVNKILNSLQLSASAKPPA